MKKKIIVSVEDLDYLKKLRSNVNDIKNMIGDLEIAKQRLFINYNEGITSENDFIAQIHAKYELPAGEFVINQDTGEIDQENSAQNESDVSAKLKEPEVKVVEGKIPKPKKPKKTPSRKLKEGEVNKKVKGPGTVEIAELG